MWSKPLGIPAHTPTMVLHLVIGCIRSGKSQRLQQEYNRQTVLNNRVSLVRSTSGRLPVDASVLLIDDYDGVTPPVQELLDWADGPNHVAYVAFDASRVDPWANSDLLKLFAHADKVEQLSSFCVACNNGTAAHFTRLKDEPVPMCRRHAYPGKGQLDMVVGPMFAGKSSALIHLIRMYRLIDKKSCVIKPKIDSRYDAASVCSHAGEKEGCITLDQLADAFQLPDYQAADVVIIEEAQFFKDLFGCVQEMNFAQGKHVYVTGLNGDFNREVFGDVLRLIPWADSVKLLVSLCKACRDGTDAIFSKRTVASKEQVLVGVQDAYAPVCRKHYLE